MRAKSYYSFGMSLHAALERLHASDDAGVQTTEEVVASLEENWVTAGYSSPEEAAEALAEGRAIVTAYMEKRYESGGTTLYLEKELRKDVGDFVLVGRLDRVDECEDGVLEIIDYKTGREFVDTADLEHDIAMNCYQLLLRNAMPGTRVRSRIIALQTLESATFEPDEAFLAEFERDLIIIGREIIGREFHEIAPTPKRICPSCDFLDLCLKHDEFAESFSGAESG